MWLLGCYLVFSEVLQFLNSGKLPVKVPSSMAERFSRSGLTPVGAEALPDPSFRRISSKKASMWLLIEKKSPKLLGRIHYNWEYCSL
jgi:hypothetical protein